MQVSQPEMGLRMPGHLLRDLGEVISTEAMLYFTFQMANKATLGAPSSQPEGQRPGSLVLECCHKQREWRMGALRTHPKAPSFSQFHLVVSALGSTLNSEG